MFKPCKYIFPSLLLLFCFNLSFGQKEKDKPFASDDNVLFGGCWFVPHNSEVNIRFSDYSNFVYHDIDSNAKEIIITGKYLLDGHNLWLIYNDRAKQKFYFYKTEGDDAHYVIKPYPIETSVYHFVHGDCD